MRPSSSSDAMASARISLSVNSLNFLSMGSSSRFVEEENRTNGGKKSPIGRNAKLPAAHSYLAARLQEDCKDDGQECRSKKSNQKYQTNPLNQESLRAAKMHNPEAVARSDLVLHAVKMILDGLFRQAELVRNFLVGQSLCDQRNDLLFPPRQSQPRVDARRVYRRSLALKEPEQKCAQRPWAHRAARMHRFHGFQDVLRRGVSWQVPSDSRSHVLKEFCLVFRHSHQQDSHGWRCQSRLA